MMRRVVFLLMIFAFAGALPAFAQTPVPASGGPVSAGAPVEVALEGGGIDYTYNASAAQTITVQARSLETEGALDTTVEVLDAQNVRLAFNDDHGTNATDLERFDSLISDLQLPAAGTYTIRVNTFSGVGTGRVELLVTTGSSAPPAAPAAQDETITGTVEAGSDFRQTFEGTLGEVVTITVRATDNQLDPVLTLLSSKDDELARNDDHGTSDDSLNRLDSRIEAFTLPANDTYTIVVTGFGASTGTFELTIERGGGAAPIPSTDATPAPQGDAEVIEGELASADDTFIHPFQATTGDVYVFTVVAADDEADFELALYDDNDNLLAFNDDHGSNDAELGYLSQHARLGNIIIPETGSYELEVRAFDSSGPFELTIERVATGAPTGDPVLESITGEIEPFGTFTHTFEALAGSYVTIEVHAFSDAFDPAVALLSADGVPLAENDDYGANYRPLTYLESRISAFPIPATGTYTLEVTGYEESAGTFALVIKTYR